VKKAWTSILGRHKYSSKSRSGAAASDNFEEELATAYNPLSFLDRLYVTEP
jgi:hypothetical protein